MPVRRLRRVVPLGAGVVALLGCLLAGCETTGTGVAGSGPPGDPEGAEDPVRMARASWDTGFFQAAIYRQLLQELGYQVTDPAAATRTPAAFYPALANGEWDLWANGWFPLHERFLERALPSLQQVSEPIEAVGSQVPQGAVQGYLVDAATAEEMDLTSMRDFTRPEVAAAFDDDGDGRADLYGCDEGWGCHREITAHLQTHEWGASVEQVSGDYDELIDRARERIDAGEPTLLYTWTPNWTVEVLEPGEDVVWLESPALPDAQGPTSVDLEGCAAANPCELGWTVNDIRAVANTDFLDAHPPIRRLLQAVEIPLADIAEQNADMAAAEDYGEADIVRDARAWIEAHRDAVDRWLQAARGR